MEFFFLLHVLGLPLSNKKEKNLVVDLTNGFAVAVVYL